MCIFACSCRISNSGENRTINLVNQDLSFGRFVKANVALMRALFGSSSLQGDPEIIYYCVKPNLTFNRFNQRYQTSWSSQETCYEMLKILKVLLL